MIDVFKQLESPSWWITVVFAGIIVNLLATYLKPLFDKGISKISTKYRFKRKEAKEKRDREIDTLSKDHHFQILKRLHAISLRIHGLTGLVLGLLVYIVIKQLVSFSDNGILIIVMGVIAVFTFAGFLDVAEGQKNDVLVDEARTLEKNRAKKPEKSTKE